MKKRKAYQKIIATILLAIITVLNIDTILLYRDYEVLGADGESFAEDKQYLTADESTGGKYFPYTGQVQEWTAPKTGVYKLEAIGAGSGGYKGLLVDRNVSITSDVGYGGYTQAYVNLYEGDKLYIAVGGYGDKSTYVQPAKGGWNGGGDAFYGATSGGGATSIASSLIGDGTVINYKDNKEDLVVVAGGAGGMSTSLHDKPGSNGYGGGETGLRIGNMSGQTIAEPGTQTTGYAFGRGENGKIINENTGSGGAGGGLYGGYSTDYYTASEGAYGGAGGSGFLNMDENSKIYAHGGVTSLKWQASQGRYAEKIIYGSGEAAINYVGPIKSTLTLALGTYASYNGQTGDVTIEGELDEVIDLSKIIIPADGNKIIGWKKISGTGIIGEKEFNYKFTSKDTKLFPLIYSDIDLYSEEKSSNKSNFKEYVYNDNIKLSWDESGNNNNKYYETYQSIDNGEFKEIIFDGYETTTANPQEFYYTGAAQTYTAPYDGKYLFELYAGNGGGDGGNTGGKGAWIKGNVNLSKDDVVTIYVGGKGISSSGSSKNTTPGGYNGGGECCWSGSGAGATDIYVNGIRVAAAAGGGGATNGLDGEGGRISTDTNDYKNTNSKNGEGSNELTDEADAGGGGGGWVGGLMGIHEGYSGERGGYGGKNGYDSNLFTLTSEGINSSSNGSLGGNDGFARVIPPTYEGLYKEKTAIVDTPDKAAPNIPENLKVVSASENNITIEWIKPEDNGTTYRHKVTAYEETTKEVLGDSNITLDVITSEIAGYFYYVDTNPTGTSEKADTYTENTYVNISIPTTKSYLHVVAVDKAGNRGPIADILIEPFETVSGSVTWVDHGNRWNIRPEKDVIILYQDGVEYKTIEIDTSKTSDTYQFTNLPKGHTYTVKQSDVGIYTENQNGFDFVNTVSFDTRKEVLKSSENINKKVLEIGEEFTYRISVLYNGNIDRKITTYDRVPDGLEIISVTDGVNIIKSQAELDEFNQRAVNGGYYSIKEDFSNLKSPIVAYLGTIEDKFLYEINVKVKEDTSDTELLNIAHTLFEGLQDVDVFSNETENMTVYSPEKEVYNEENEEINQNVITEGNTLTYKIKFKNVSENNETAKIIDNLPTEVEYIESTNGGVYNEKSHSVEWNVEAIAKTESFVEVKVRVLDETKGKIIKNSANITLNEITQTTNEVENTVVENSSKQVLNKDGEIINKEIIKVGDVITYNIEIKNSSNKTKEFTVTDTLPEGIEFVEASDNGSYSSGKIVWNVNVEAKAQKKVSVKVKVLETAKGKQLKNKANVTVDGISNDTNEVENFVISEPVKQVENYTGESIENETLNYKEEITYSIKVKNPSNITKKFTIVDELPINTEFIETTENGKYKDGKVTWEKEIEAGKEIVLKVKVKVIAEKEEIIIKNKATVLVDKITIETNEVENKINPIPKGKIIIKYIDENGEEIETAEEILDYIGEEYQTQPKEIKDYKYIKAEGNENGVFEEEEQVIKYYYAKIVVPNKEVYNSKNENIDLDVVKEGDILTYKIHFKNIEENTEIAKIVDNLPIEVEYIDSTNEGVYDMNSHSVEWNVEVSGKTEANVEVRVKVLNETKGKTITNKADITLNDLTQTTEEVENYVMDNPVKQAKNANNEDIENKTVNDKEEITYSIKVKNPSNSKKIFTIIDELPTNTEFIEATESGIYKDGKVTWEKEIEAGKEVIFEVRVRVIAEKEEIVIKNKATVLVDKVTIETNEVENTVSSIPKGRIIVKYLDENGEEIETSEEITDQVGEEYQTQPKDIEKYRYIKVEGNENGVFKEEMQEIIYYYEKIPAKVIVKYVDIDSEEDISYIDNDGNEKVYSYEEKNYMGEEYATQEKNLEYYELVELPKNKEGKYTEEENTVIYYYKKLPFNMKVDISIKEIIVDGENKKVSEDGKLEKVEIKSSKLDETEVIVKYKVVVKNTHKIEGTAELVENIPLGYEIASSNPKYWEVLEDGKLTTTVQLQPGEEKELEVVLVWKKGDLNLGTANNIVEIINTTNVPNFDDIIVEDNKSNAESIITIKTGTEDFIVVAGRMMELDVILIFVILGIKSRRDKKRKKL